MLDQQHRYTGYNLDLLGNLKAINIAVVCIDVCCALLLFLLLCTCCVLICACCILLLFVLICCGYGCCCCGCASVDLVYFILDCFHEWRATQSTGAGATTDTSPPPTVDFWNAYFER